MKLKNIAIATLISLLTTIGAFAAPPSNDNFANAQLMISMQVHYSGNNAEATKEANEPNHATNVGGKSVWYKWTAIMSRNVMITTNRSATNIDTLLNVYTGTSLSNLQSVYYNNDIHSSTNLRSSVILNAVEGTTYYIAVDGYSDGTNPAAEGEFRIDIQPYYMYQGADYDRDGMTDLSVFRPSTGTWLINGTTRSFNEQWGMNGDIPVVAGGSSVPGMTLFRPSDGVWYFHVPFPIETYTPYGTNGDIPVPDDYTGQITNFSVYRPSNNTWYIRANNGSSQYYQFGSQGDLPVPGQYSPDANADIAVFRPSNGVWYFIIRSGIQGLESFRAVKFGQEGDKPVPADYDGDGMLDIAVYRPSTGVWWVFRSSDQQAMAFQWGIAEDIPTTGDFDGDGKSDYAVFRPSTGVWYIYRRSDNQVQIKQFGQTGDIPMTANKAF